MAIRRNLSGVFIFEQFEGEEKRQPTCFEDCTEATQNKWLSDMSNENLISLAKHLAKTINDIAESFDIVKE